MCPERRRLSRGLAVGVEKQQTRFSVCCMVLSSLDAHLGYLATVVSDLVHFVMERALREDPVCE